MRADFSKFLGPLPTDPQYTDPKGAAPLKALDANDSGIVSRTRVELEAHRVSLNEAAAAKRCKA